MTHIEKIVNAYKHLSKVPTLVSGKLNNKGNRITSKWSVRNLEKGITTKYMYNYLLDDKLGVISESEFGTDVTNELLSAVSPLETYKAVIREETIRVEGKPSKKQFLEVWRKNQLAHCIDLTALDLHGDVYADSEFGSIDWSADETAVLYVAEKKMKKSEPYIKRKPTEDHSKTDGTPINVAEKGDEFIFRQDWGEQLVGKFFSVICVCHVKEEKVTVLEGLPETWCPGQVRFGAAGGAGEGAGAGGAIAGGSVTGVAWETEPRRLGLIFCTNRPSCVFNLTLDGHLTRLSGEGLSVRSPRVSPDGRVLWLERRSGGPHHACHKLVVATRDHAQAQEAAATVIDYVATESKTSNNNSFYGLYNLGLPGRCFASGGRVLLSSPQRTELRAYVVDIENSHIVDISNTSVPGSTSILDVKSDVVLASCSNMTTPPQLYVARLPEKGKEADINWVRVGQQDEILESCTIEYFNLEHEQTTDSVKSFSAIYFAPAPAPAPGVAEDKAKLPLVVWPHGGPHSCFVNTYSLEATLFNMLGFASLQVNYRGSSGAGQASVEFLPGRAGDADVKDCKLATDETVKKFPIDERNLTLMGGSHGGFLVTHLSGQYPDTYCAVVSRNPVTDIATMCNTTDIPDWCAVEAGYVFTEEGAVSDEVLLAMRRLSPLAHVHKVKAPTAMMLGSGDKRVPYYQGLEYIRRLKANGVATRVYMYDDNHSLSSIPAEMDNLINGAHWFLQHMRT